MKLFGKIAVSGYVIPLLYTIAISAAVLFQWDIQYKIRYGTGSSIHCNLMEESAYARKGFDANDILKIPQVSDETGWVRFRNPPFRITNSNLPDLPKRAFLSPFGRKAQEFTIVIPVEINDEITELPGIFLGYIGENWEIYLNGHLVQSQMHLNGDGSIKSRRVWRDVYFPVEKEFLVRGTNILAMRIIGDPSHSGTGLYYTAPYYIDEYSIIKKQNQNIVLLFLCGIFGYTGISYLVIFFSVRKKEELFNLYFGIFSVLLCVYSLSGNGIINSIIPNSDIQVRMEYASLFLMIPMVCIFVEELGQKKITAVSKGFLVFTLILLLPQTLFCNEFGNEILMIWTILSLAYFSYVFVYDILYFYFVRRRKMENGKPDTFVSILISAVIVFVCGIWDVLDVVFFYSSLRLFVYSIFVFHIGMVFTLSNHFQGMYQKLEQSHVMLEETVQQRTQELKKQTKIAVEASQAKSRFLATTSHEIRTPLNAVIGLSQIELQSNASNNVRHIHQSAMTLLGIINDILDISKIEAGKIELYPAEYETALFISDSVNLNRIRIGSKQIEFILNIDENLPSRLYGDELRLKQILNNLLSNAIKYTEKGFVKLSVNIVSETEDKDITLRFTVEDSGHGIKEEHMERLFTQFERFNAEANRKTEGTGLGLHITRELVAMMNGSIEVESEYGKGSVFTVTVVQKAAQGSAAIGKETARQLRDFTFYTNMIMSQSRMVYEPMPYGKVLVVDDVKTNLYVLENLLAPYELKIETTLSSHEAMKKAAEGTYDLIFMDHMMPDMDGIETTLKLRANGYTGAIVALTANALVGNDFMFKENGFDDFIAKPIDIYQLNACLEKYVRDRHPEEERGSLARHPSPSPIMLAALENQRIDILNHYRHSLEKGSSFDASYFEKFTAMVETFDTEETPADLREQAALLLEAAKKGDVEKIRESIGPFIEALQSKEALQKKTFGKEQENGVLTETLTKLKKAVADGQSEQADLIMAELGAINLNPTGRELYFLLHDLFLSGENEKAIGAISLWEKLHSTEVV
jgi:signal transduction histidine kinase/CheY-like chemotaxis protein